MKVHTHIHTHIHTHTYIHTQACLHSRSLGPYLTVKLAALAWLRCNLNVTAAVWLVLDWGAALVDDGAVTGWGEERGNTGAASADALGKGALQEKSEAQRESVCVCVCVCGCQCVYVWI